MTVCILIVLDLGGVGLSFACNFDIFWSYLHVLDFVTCHADRRSLEEVHCIKPLILLQYILSVFAFSEACLL